jgi:hypothetical protein
MFRYTTVRTTLAFIAAAGLCSAVNAELFRAYVSGSGNDANPCTLQQPCRLLPAALNAVAPGGEIWMTDSANYNTATVEVTKSVSILAVPGVVGSIVAQNGGPAVSITTADLEVALRNVVLGPVAGAAAGTAGIYMTSDSTLTLENSLVADLPQDGVYVNGLGTVRIVDTTLRNMGQLAVHLMNGATVDISGSQMLDNGWGGVRATGTSGTTLASVSDSVISGGNFGVRAVASTGATARVTVTRSTITRTDAAVLCYPGGTNTVFLGNTLIAYNISAFSEDCTGIYTSGNNQFNNNGTPTGTLTALPLQ